jgi:hypothetical protein
MVCVPVNDNAKVWVHAQLQVLKLPPGRNEILPSAACTIPKLHLCATSGFVVVD